MWTRQNLSAAAAWFDRQLTDETLDPVPGSGGNLLDPKTSFESLLVRALAAHDPAAASKRLLSMSEATRAAAWHGDWFSRLRTDQVKAVADFLRDHSGGDPELWARAATGRLRQGTLAYAAEFLNTIEPSPDERSALVAESLRCRILEGDELRTSPGEARAWILEHAGHDADRLTGVALAQFAEWHDFAEMAQLALNYRNESGQDEVLVAFLKAAPEHHRPQILLMADEVGDQAARDAIARRFVGGPGGGSAGVDTE